MKNSWEKHHPIFQEKHAYSLESVYLQKTGSFGGFRVIVSIQGQVRCCQSERCFNMLIFLRIFLLNFQCCSFSSWWFSTHLKNIARQIESFPRSRGKHM